METLYRDRYEAGKFLAGKLTQLANDPSLVVLALPRGGVPVACEVARSLHAPLDVFLVRKLGVPGHEELAMGAIASGGILVLNEEVVRHLGATQATINTIAAEQNRQLLQREATYRRGRDALEVRGRTIILVDDGLATGASMRAAVMALRRRHPARIIVAVPVGAAETCGQLREEADEVICGQCPLRFGAVSAWYEDFTQTTDAEVVELLDRATLAARQH